MDPKRPILELVFDEYNRVHAGKTGSTPEGLAGIEQELERIGQLVLEGIPSQTVERRLFDRMTELEVQKLKVEPLLVPATARAESVIGQLKAIRRTIDEAERVTMAGLLDMFIEKVIPRFEVKTVGKGKRRTVLRAVRSFIPRGTEAAQSVAQRGEDGNWR